MDTKCHASVTVSVVFTKWKEAILPGEKNHSEFIWNRRNRSRHSNKQLVCCQAINKGLSVKRSLGDASFCRSCTKIDKVVFDAISANQGISRFCESCQTVPGVQKLLVTIGNIVARQDELGDRVQKIEKNV